MIQYKQWWLTGNILELPDIIMDPVINAGCPIFIQNHHYIYIQQNLNFKSF